MILGDPEAAPTLVLFTGEAEKPILIDRQHYEVRLSGERVEAGETERSYHFYWSRGALPGDEFVSITFVV
jgi:hypothetical protein